MTPSEWTYNQNYQQGLMILQQSNISPTILTWLQKAENTATKAMMKKLITALIHAQQSTPLPTQKQPEKPTKPLLSEQKATKSQLKGYDENAQDAPESVKALVEKRKKLFQQKRNTKAQLNQIVWFESRFSNTERGIKKNEHEDIITELKEVWKDINYYRQYGTLPSPIVIDKPPINANEIRLRINTLRTYISKAKKSDKKPKRYDEYLQELYALETKLKDE